MGREIFDFLLVAEIFYLVTSFTCVNPDLLASFKNIFVFLIRFLLRCALTITLTLTLTLTDEIEELTEITAQKDVSLKETFCRWKL